MKSMQDAINKKSSQQNVDIHIRPMNHISLFEARIPDYDYIKDDLKKYIYNVDVNRHLTEEVSGDYPLGIGPHEQRHKKRLVECMPNLFDDTTNEALNRLKTFCQGSVDSIARRINQSIIDTSGWVVDFVDSWFHITKDGGYHDHHTHSGSAWSGIFYVDIGESNYESANGINRFYAPFEAPMILGLNAINCNYFDVDPQDGKLIICPGFIPHSALPYYGDKDRIVIAFNTIIHNQNNLVNNNWSRAQNSFYKDNGDSDEKI